MRKWITMNFDYILSTIKLKCNCFHCHSFDARISITVRCALLKLGALKTSLVFVKLFFQINGAF